MAGRRDQHLQSLADPGHAENYPLEVLKRREWVRQNRLRREADPQTNCRVDMIGSGNRFDTSKVETMIAREHYFNARNQATRGEDAAEAKPRPSEDQGFPSRASQSQFIRGDSRRGEGWPPEEQEFGRESSQGLGGYEARGSVNAKKHNDALFQKKAAARKSVGLESLRRGAQSGAEARRRSSVARGFKPMAHPM